MRLFRRLGVLLAAICVAPLVAVAMSAPAQAQAGTSSLAAGEQLTAGQSLISPSGAWTLALQPDGNLVYSSASRISWNSATPGNPGATLSMQTDGNLVLRSADGRVLFATGTPAHTGAVLTVSDSPQFTLVAAGRVFWRSPDATLSAGQRLAPGDFLTSPTTTLTMQTDGNLVLRGTSATVWNSRTGGHPGASLYMQADGNAVIRTATGAVLFSTATTGHPRAALTVGAAVTVAIGARKLWVSPPTVQAAANAAVAYGRSRGERVAVAVLDRHTGTYYLAGDATAYYSSASVMKVFIAAKLLATGQAADPATEALMWSMITLSDNNAADTLYNEVGGAAVATWAAQRYGVTGIAPTPSADYWGLTQITAQAMVSFYNGIAKDPAVGPWLMNAMGHMAATAGDGWPQGFGIPSATTDWQVKQGWMSWMDDAAFLNSTGFVGGGRYTVAILTEGPPADFSSYGRTTITTMARLLMPGGKIPAPPA